MKFQIRNLWLKSSYLTAPTSLLESATILHVVFMTQFKSCKIYVLVYFIVWVTRRPELPFSRVNSDLLYAEWGWPFARSTTSGGLGSCGVNDWISQTTKIKSYRFDMKLKLAVWHGQCSGSDVHSFFFFFKSRYLTCNKQTLLLRHTCGVSPPVGLMCIVLEWLRHGLAPGNDVHNWLMSGSLLDQLRSEFQE